MEQTHEERYRAAKLLDDVLVLFDLYTEDYNIVEDALNEIARVKKENPAFPLTVTLQEYMEMKGYLPHPKYG